MGFKGIDSKSQRKLKEAREKNKQVNLEKERKDDLSTEEFIQLGMKYLKIPYLNLNFFEY